MDIKKQVKNMLEKLKDDTKCMPFSTQSEFANDLKKMIIKLFSIHSVSDSVSVSLISETIYLLRKNQLENCPNWKVYEGDCHKSNCEFCRIEKCIDSLEIL